jgi:ectoine hydroxylase-related dioxygenase (phytanoyl-CoA dioxygenase family)
MDKIKEFTKEHVDENSTKENGLFYDFLHSKEPYQSIFKNNPWMIPPDLKKPLDWGGDHYWNTTVARKHEYWKEFDLPKPSKDINQIRKDFLEWGFALIEDAMSKEQTDEFLDRLLEQAEGERLAKVENLTPSGQYVNTLINKGEVFVQCIEQNTGAVQAGPLIEQLLNESLGKGWICHSFLANGADPEGYPQGLHMDQGPLSPWMTQEAPALVNTMYIPQDINEENGGTLVIPGSHKIMIKAGSNGKVGKLPPAINLEAKAGSIMIFDGRLLHGTAVNKSDKSRFVATMSNVKPWMRTQENWILSVAPEILKNASPKLLHRIGLQALTYGSTIEGFGLGASGRIGDKWGAINQFRIAYDEGNYERVRELSKNSSKKDLTKRYTVKRATKKAKN